MASLTPTFSGVGLSYFTDVAASVRLCVCDCVSKGPFHPLFVLSLPLSLFLAVFLC